MVQTFINSCLRRISRIHWPITINNNDLWQRTNQRPADVKVMLRRWRWMGHTLLKPFTSITRHALSWNPRPRNSRRRERKVQDRDSWKTLLGGLCPKGGIVGVFEWINSLLLDSRLSFTIRLVVETCYHNFEQVLWREIFSISLHIGPTNCFFGTPSRLLPNKYFMEPRRAKAETLGAQQVMCWEPLQKN